MIPALLRRMVNAMKIIVDAFGGDNAPLEVLKGCQRAVSEFEVNILLAGDESILKKAADDNEISLSGMEILHAPGTFDIHDEPNTILKKNADTSLGVALNALKDGKGDAVVSAGSTGALVFGSIFIVKRIKGIKRAALAPLLPTTKGPFILLDAGANADCRADMLNQFGIMGSCYMQRVLKMQNPRVALINIGAEETKGRALEIEAHSLLSNSSINFCGNIEARHLPFGDADVVVADGYTGNIVLKLYEGMGKFFSTSLKEMFTANLKTKIAAGLLMNEINSFRKRMDYTEYGGAVLLGISKPVIKAHGSSNDKAFFNAIRQAKNCVEGDFVGEIIRNINL